MKCLITGLGHSGTTYVHSLLTEATGWSVGMEELHGVSPRQGREHLGLLAPATDAMHRLRLRPDEPLQTEFRWDWRKEDLSDIEDQIEELPELVKIPQLGVLGLLSTVDPDWIVVVDRQLDEWVRSMQSNGDARQLDVQELYRRGAIGKAQILETVIRVGCPVTYVQFPKVAQNVSYASEVFREHIESWRIIKAHDAVTRLEWVGENSRRFGGTRL